MVQEHTLPDGTIVQIEVPGHHWKDADRVEEYITRTDSQADQRVAVFNFMCDLFPFETDAAIRVLDIGSGHGAVAAAVLERFPNATAIGLDISEPMMEAGRQRMAQFGNRFAYHLGDFANGSLPDDLPGRFDAVVSASAIHHLPSDAKQRLYKAIFGRLNDGGCFFNVDQTTGEDEDTKAFYRRLRERERERHGEAPRQAPSAHAVMTHHHIETVKDQIAWLRAAGFRSVDCFWKRMAQTVIGGYRLA